VADSPVQHGGSSGKPRVGGPEAAKRAGLRARQRPGTEGQTRRARRDEMRRDVRRPRRGEACRDPRRDRGSRSDVACAQRSRSAARRRVVRSMTAPACRVRKRQGNERSRAAYAPAKGGGGPDGVQASGFDLDHVGARSARIRPPERLAGRPPDATEVSGGAGMRPLYYGGDGAARGHSWKSFDPAELFPVGWLANEMETESPDPVGSEGGRVTGDLRARRHGAHSRGPQRAAREREAASASSLPSSFGSSPSSRGRDTSPERSPTGAPAPRRACRSRLPSSPRGQC